MDKRPSRKKFVEIKIDLNKEDKAKITAKIIFKKDDPKHEHAQIELRFNSKDDTQIRTIIIPPKLSRAGGEMFLDKVNRTLEQFREDLEYASTYIAQYHLAKTGELPGDEKDVRWRRASLKLYERVAKELYNHLFGALSQISSFTSGETQQVYEFLDTLPLPEPADYTRIARDVIMKDEASYPYALDSMERNIREYDLAMDRMFGSIDKFASDRRQLYAAPSVNDDSRVREIKEKNLINKTRKIIHDAICAMDDAWLKCALSISEHGHVTKEDGTAMALDIVNQVKEAQKAYIDLKHEINYHPRNTVNKSGKDELSAGDMIDGIEEYLDDMADRAKVFADPLKIRDIVSRVESKSVGR